jgi:hypothetical protein
LPMMNMLAFKVLLLAIILPHGFARSETPLQEVMRFPRSIGEWTADTSTAKIYDAQGRDRSLSYIDPRRGCVTVYVYPRGGRGLDEEFERVIEHLLAVHENVKPKRTAVLSDFLEGRELWLDGVRALPARAKVSVKTALYLFERDGWFIKVRASFPIDREDAAQSVEAFLDAWRRPSVTL